MEHQADGRPLVLEIKIFQSGSLKKTKLEGLFCLQLSASTKQIVHSLQICISVTEWDISFHV